MHLAAESRVGIGTNNTSPVSELDVRGLITASTGLNVTGTTNSTLVGNGSIKTAGGLSVALNSNFGGTLSTYSAILVNNLNGLGAPTTAAVIQPGSDAANVLYDIGTPTRRFRNMYAQTFVGNFSGNFTGSLTGQVTGKADALSSPTVFRLAGDVSSQDLEFDGQGDNPMTFQTTINQDYITSKTAATDSVSTDQFLVYRSSTNSLLKMTKQTFFNHVATVPVGAIMPFAGTTIPNGYLLCDGCEVEISKFSVLYGAIGHTYKAFSLLRGLNTFGLPDLRGRFPLGADNMNNTITVPYKDGSGTLVSTNLDKDGVTLSSVANRVTDITADTVGTGSGSQSGVVSGTGAGGVTSGGTSITVMNPYATINYIIYTGVIL
jgi:microcystin-dependent protein